MTRTISHTCIVAMLSIGVTAYAQTTGQSPTQPTSQAGSQRMEQGRQAGDRSQTEQQITLVGCIQREADYRQANQGGRGGTMGTGIGVGNEFVLINATTGSQTAMSGSTGQPSGTMSGSATAGTSGTTASGTAATTGSATGTTSGTGSTASGTTSGTGTTGSASGSSTTPCSTPSHTQHSGMSVSAGGTAYALTGDREKDLEQYVGQRVEIVGRVEGGSNRGGYSAGASGSGTAGSGTSATGTASGTTSGTTGSATGTTSTGAETTTGTSATGSRTGSGSASAGSQGQGFGNLQQLNVVSFRAVGGSCSAQ